MDNRAVGNDIAVALGVCVSSVSAHGNAAHENSSIGHLVGFKHLEPLIRQTAADSRSCCFDYAHINIPPEK